MNNYRISNEAILNKTKINNNGSINKSGANRAVGNVNGPSFRDVLDKINKGGELKFSKHATQRLETRNIKLSDTDVKKINSAVDKAQEKGVNEALIMMGNKAFIVNVNNRTVITAASDDQLKENVFTNIDGAVII
jgi:flagellar operon protein